MTKTAFQAVVLLLNPPARETRFKLCQAGKPCPPTWCRQVQSIFASVKGCTCGLQSTALMLTRPSPKCSLYVPVLVLVVLFVCLSAWNDVSPVAFSSFRSGLLSRYRAQPAGTSTKCIADSSRCQSPGKASWWQHPAVFTFQRLGLWQTSFLGVVGHSKAAQDATVLQHWWRCQPAADGLINLRGVGSAYSAVDTNQLMQLVPWGVNDSWAGLNITDITVNHTWQVQQSAVQTNGINVWHAEAPSLSSSSSFSIRPSSSLSKHSYEWDASYCKPSPQVFRPGSIWTVVTQAAEYNISLYAKLLVQHTSYHQSVGFAGTILVISRSMAAKLSQQLEVQEGLDDGSFVIIVWEGDIVPSMPYYYQYLMYNMAVLATWGVPDIKLAMIDLDEFYILPKHLTFTEALKPGGCLHGYHNIRMFRVNAYFGITPADASACYKAAQAAKADTSRTTVKVNITDCGSPCIVKDNSVLRRCKELESSFTPDIHGLTTTGWQNYFKQQKQEQRYKPVDRTDAVSQLRRQQFEVQQVEDIQQQQLPVGYVDKHLATAPSFRYAHKSLVDPNYVAGYAVHEASVILPGGKDTKNGMSHQCVFGIHMLNMYRYRSFGAGLQLALDGKHAFSLADHANRVVQLEQGG